VLAANPSLVYPFQAMAYACGVPVWLAVGPRNEVETLIERYYGQGRSAMGTLIENLDEQGGALERHRTPQGHGLRSAGDSPGQT